MESNKSKIIIFFLSSFSLLFLHSNAASFNITSVLEKYPNYSTFNSYLSQTQVASAINAHGTVTVLAVDNSAVSSLSGKSPEVLKRIMSVHAVLDYFDVKKFHNLDNKTTKLTTLFQSTGLAMGDQGFLNATEMGGGTVMIGSAVKEASLGSNLVGLVTSMPYDLSVVQVSSVIIPPGIDSIAPSSSSSPPPPPQSPNQSPSPSTAAAPSPRKMLSPPSPPPSDATPPTESDSPADAPTEDDSKSAGSRAVCLGIVAAMISSILAFMI